MADTAFITQYRDEAIAVYEREQSLLSQCCVNEFVRNGNTATFLVAGSGSATAVTRGVNGRIPARPDSLTQTSATLQEWHDKVVKTNFNIFASQGNQRAIMQRTTMGTLNRKVDDDIIAQLDTATIDTGTTTTASVAMVSKSLGYLGNQNVPLEDEENIFGLITPAFWGYLMETREFASGEYVETKMFNGSIRKMFRWFGVNWIRHSGLTGLGTSTEFCYLFHRNAIGHAADVAGMDVDVGYNGEDAYSYARVSVHVGSKLLQNTGIVQMKHDGSRTALS
jgi:hypothetical protein